MKKISLLVIMLSVVIFSAQAQEKRLNLYGGYVFDDNLNYYSTYNQYVNGTVKGGFQYGASLEFINPDELGIELLYIGQNTTLPLSFNSAFLNGARNATNDLNLNYALMGINRYAKEGKMEGYGGLLLGCLFTSVKNTGISDSSSNKYSGISASATRFTWGLKLGANFWVKDNIAIKFQTQLLSTTDAVGGAAYYGYYYGYYNYITMWQFSFNTGLVFRFKN